MTFLAMSENGRVLIPAALREQLGFKPNSRIFIEVDEGCLVLMSGAERSARRRAYFDRVMPNTGDRSLSDELIADRRLEAAKEDAE